MPSKIYLAHAAQERDAASRTNLPNRREMHERSAAVWEEMARSVDDTAERKRVNLEAKTHNGANAVAMIDRAALLVDV